MEEDDIQQFAFNSSPRLFYLFHLNCLTHRELRPALELLNFVRSNNISAVQRLLVEQPFKEDILNRAVLLAVAAHLWTMIQALLDNESFVFSDEIKVQVLLSAAKMGFLDIVQGLLERQDRAFSNTVKHQTLDLARDQRQYELVQWLEDFLGLEPALGEVSPRLRLFGG